MAVETLNAERHARQALDRLHTGGGQGPRHEGYLTFGRVNARIWLVLCLAELGRFDEAAILGQEANDIARGTNGPEEQIFAGLGVGRMHVIQGKGLESPNEPIIAPGWVVRRTLRNVEKVPNAALLRVRMLVLK